MSSSGLPSFLSSSSTPLGCVQEWKNEGTELKLKGEKFEVSIANLAKGLLKVVIQTHDDVPQIPDELLVRTNWEPIPLNTSESSSQLTIQGNGIQAKVDLNSLRFEFFNETGQLLWNETEDFGLVRDGKRLWSVRTLSNEQRLFGLGEHVGPLELKERQYDIWNVNVNPHLPNIKSMYQAIPFLLGMTGETKWGYFVQSTSNVTFDLGKTDHRYQAVGVDVTPFVYYVFTGEIPEILEQYSQLTGRMPLPPKWSIGHHQSRYSYESADRVVEIAQEFRKRNIPTDSIHLDIHYMDGFRVFTWNPETFSNYKEMIDKTSSLGMHLVTIIDPGIKVDETYPVYSEGRDNGHLIQTKDGTEFHGIVWPGLTAFPDYYNPNVQKWWGDLHKELLKDGISGIWNDMNEPALRVNDQGIPDTMNDCVHTFNDSLTLPHTTVHNAFALFEAKATYEGMCRLRPNERPFILTRSGSAGIQKYAAVWTGDNCSWWEHLSMSIPMCLNLGLSGVPFVGTDIGGFIDDCTPELYARWVEAGSLFPFCRTHTDLNTRDQEPWSFGEEVESIAKRYISYRYRLLPYFYSLFSQGSRYGLPIMRPIWWSDPSDQTALPVADQFLIGDSLLVAPVITAKAENRSVYLPTGTWYNAWTGTKEEGRRFIIENAPLDRLPMYIKAGSIIPIGPVVQHVGERQSEQLEMLITPGNGSFDWYEDDGITFEHLNHNYCQRTIHVNDKQDSLEITLLSSEGAYNPNYSTILLHVACLDQAPKAVSIDDNMDIPLISIEKHAYLDGDAIFAQSCPVNWSENTYEYSYSAKDMWIRLPYVTDDIKVSIKFTM